MWRAYFTEQKIGIKKHCRGTTPQINFAKNKVVNARKAWSCMPPPSPERHATDYNQGAKISSVSLLQVRVEVVQSPWGWLTVVQAPYKRALCPGASPHRITQVPRKIMKVQPWALGHRQGLQNNTVAPPSSGGEVRCGCKTGRAHLSAPPPPSRTFARKASYMRNFPPYSTGFLPYAPRLHVAVHIAQNRLQGTTPTTAYEL